MTEPSKTTTTQQTLVGIGVLLIGALIAWGASYIPSDAGYAGVGPNALPWVVAAALLLCGGLLVWQARSGGFRDLEPPSGAVRGDWPALAWVAGAVLANALLIERIGFVLACALCFALAVRGLRLSEGKPAGTLMRSGIDLLTGLAIAAPVFWLFTKLLAINLPSLGGLGWI